MQEDTSHETPEQKTPEQTSNTKLFDGMVDVHGNDTIGDVTPEPGDDSKTTPAKPGANEPPTNGSGANETPPERIDRVPAVPRNKLPKSVPDSSGEASRQQSSTAKVLAAERLSDYIKL